MSNPIILAAVDIDARATAVIAHAARLAALCQGRLVVIHVVDYTC
jgi:K+-sensing histidine kinase KdpD